MKFLMECVCPTARTHLNNPTTFFFFGLEDSRSAGSDVTDRD